MCVCVSSFVNHQKMQSIVAELSSQAPLGALDEEDLDGEAEGDVRGEGAEEEGGAGDEAWGGEVGQDLRARSARESGVARARRSRAYQGRGRARADRARRYHAHPATVRHGLRHPEARPVSTG